MKPIGLSDQEAEKRLATYGPNEIADKPRATPFQIFASQFTSLLIVLLMIAAVLSLFLGDVLDGIFILLIVILNGVLGFVQEYKAEAAIAALKKMTVSSIRVIRGGVEHKIDSKMLVPGDIILLEEGDKIPADCRLMESLHLEANEASLTGESMPVEKTVADGSKNHIFLGTIVAKGRAKAIVETTGMETKFGGIAASLSSIGEEETPLQKKLDTLGKQLGIVAIFASGVVFVIGYFSHQPFIEMILTSVSLAVAAVPEGLPAVITITLAIGMQRMAKKKAILRKLSSIEALGSTTIIATDKTGTLTKNQMRVVNMWTHEKTERARHDLLTTGILCNNASLVYKEDHSSYDVLGDTTEGALLLLAADKGLDAQQVKLNGSLVEEFAFDPALKMMSVVWKNDGMFTIYSKGAPESVLARCARLTATEKNTIEKLFQQYASTGLRVIALAQKNVRTVPESRESAERDLTFLGFVGIADPARGEVKDAIALARVAGIKTIMITGDNELTARAIGAKIGLLQKGDEVITGTQFSQLSDQEAIERLPVIRIFARTTPDQKLRIVQLLQRMGHVVAVTGDGVNDAPAIKQADVGVAMGITGTDVAKEASDMILTDDNYATLVTAVEEGRTIFDNIKSAIQYLVGCNIGEILAVVTAMLLGWPLILTPLQLLYINLVTDGLPAIALAVTPKHERIMQRKPRTRSNIFDRVDMVWFFEVSLLTAATTLVAFWIGYKTQHVEIARAFAFTTIILVQHFIFWDVRVRERSIFQKNLLKDSMFLFTFFTPLVLQLLLLYVPVLSGIFHIARISAAQLASVILLSSVLLVTSEVRKKLLHHETSH
jgi:Ca2+-transporting ATPase